jgi:hypothetical protein
MAGEEPVVALHAREPPGDPPQQPVAGAVAERVVDELEVVEIDEQQRDAIAPPPRAGHRRPQPRVELRAVRQPGELVEEGQPARLLLRAHALRDVLS